MLTERVNSSTTDFQEAYLADNVRTFLVNEWDDYKNADQPERIYCASFKTSRDSVEQVTTYKVDSILSTPTLYSTPISSSINCGDPLTRYVNSDVIFIHTHPPTTCDQNLLNCHFGGRLAWICNPSRADLAVVWRYNYKFGALQCDRNAIVFFGFSQSIIIPQGIAGAK